MTLIKKRWYLLVIACLINIAAGSIYAWSVFSPAKAAQMSQTLGTTVTAGELSIIFSVANAMCPVTMIFGGLIIDRIGPKLVTVAGGILIALGLFGAGLSTTITELIFTYGILFGLGIGLVYGAVISNTIKFFPDHRGLVAGLTTASYSICAFFLPPIATALIANVGIVSAFEIFALALGGVIVLGGFLSMKCPENFQVSGFAFKSSTRYHSSREFSWRQMLKTPTFYCMFGFMICSSLAGMMIGSQATSIASEKIGLIGQAAALSVSIFALFNTFGRVIAGFISDWIGRFPTILAASGLSVIGLLLLLIADSTCSSLFYASMLILGGAMGGFMGIYPAFTADEFGTVNNSTNYGLMFCACSISGFLGSGVVNYLKGVSNGYELPIQGAVCVTLLGFGFAWLYWRFCRTN